MCYFSAKFGYFLILLAGGVFWLFSKYFGGKFGEFL